LTRLKDLKRIEVIADDEAEITEAARRMSDNYDFVVTSGGIGPTYVRGNKRDWRIRVCVTEAGACRHDDITYPAIAKAFGLRLRLHEEAYERMKRLSRPHPSQPDFSWEVDSPARTAKLRMAQLPTDDSRDLKPQALFPRDDMWVPVAVVNGNIHILPGVPRLFEALLEGLRPSLLPRLADPTGGGTFRVLVSTPLPKAVSLPT